MTRRMQLDDLTRLAVPSQPAPELTSPGSSPVCTWR